VRASLVRKISFLHQILLPCLLQTGLYFEDTLSVNVVSYLPTVNHLF